MMHAVITGDIVNSTKLGEQNEKKLVHELHQILALYKFEFYRGDSFQVFIEESQEALLVALRCRTAAIGLTPDENPAVSDVRISIGIGKVEGQVDILGSAKGEAFLLSGRSLDELEKTEGRLIVTIENKLANQAFKIMTSYINSMYNQMTPKQAEVIIELLKGETQQQVADKLNKSKSTISQHVTAGRWDEIDEVIKDYKNIIELISG
ncbi:MAG: hypothetical protein ABI415_06705 [Flavitalea sp.]